MTYQQDDLDAKKTCNLPLIHFLMFDLDIVESFEVFRLIMFVFPHFSRWAVVAVTVGVVHVQLIGSCHHTFVWSSTADVVGQEAKMGVQRPWWVHYFVRMLDTELFKSSFLQIVAVPQLKHPVFEKRHWKEKILLGCLYVVILVNDYGMSVIRVGFCEITVHVPPTIRSRWRIRLSANQCWCNKINS